MELIVRRLESQHIASGSTVPENKKSEKIRGIRSEWVIDPEPAGQDEAETGSPFYRNEKGTNVIENLKFIYSV